MLPVKRDGTTLALIPKWRDDPHGWIKLWKQHAAKQQADQINETARKLGEAWLPRYGGKISSEWFFSKALQMLKEGPELYADEDGLIEAADWVIWQLTGVETRNACTAGYKAMVQDEGFPKKEYFAALDPRFADVVDTRMSREFAQLGACAGRLTEQAAKWTGLLPGTPVAVANVDAHVSVPAVKVTQPGVMVMIMGTSTCHILLASNLQTPPATSPLLPARIIPRYS